MKLPADDKEVLVIAAAVALHGILASHVMWEPKFETQEARINDTLDAAFEIARAFLKRVEAL